MASERTLDDHRVLVTGGTGSLGRALVRRLLGGELGRPSLVTVFSRDEGKQHDMRMAFRRLATASEDAIYRDYEDILRFRVGDVRDFDALASALRGADVVFHAAAMKQVPTCEYSPMEAVATNVLGAQNLVRAIEGLSLQVQTVVGVSTDKACKPVNVMGMTKALQERILIHANLSCPGTRFVCARYGNVLGSRGSVLPVFHAQVEAGGPVTLTSRSMTRFMLSQRQAIDALVDAHAWGGPGDILVPRVRSARIEDIASCLIGARDVRVVENGIRPGEKLHEILVAEDEAPRTSARDGYYVIASALPELGRRDAAGSALTVEFSSAEAPMSAAETLAMLRENALLVEDAPDFSAL